MSSGKKGCAALAVADFVRNPVPPDAPDAIKSNWGNRSQCRGIPVPVLTILSTDMISPDGAHHKRNGAPSPFNPFNASLSGHADGPQGTWVMNNSVTWALFAPGWKWGTPKGLCTGAHTPVVTCYYPQAYRVTL